MFYIRRDFHSSISFIKSDLDPIFSQIFNYSTPLKMLGFEGGRLLHHICRCLENLDRLTDGQVELDDELEADQGDGCAAVRLAVRPKSGPYTGGRFIFKVRAHSST